MSHARRTYGQYCGLARAFDVIGERWTPLVLRQLMNGPQRYADLLEALPGIGTSLLAARLKQLEADGVVEQRRLPPPAARNVYALTEGGAELADALLPLARWGARRLGTRQRDEAFRLEWFLLYVRSVADPAGAVGVHDVYEFHVDGDVFHVIVDDGVIDAHFGEAPTSPDLVVTTDVDTFVSLGDPAVSPADPKVAKRMRVEGDPKVAARALKILAPAR